MRGDSGGVGLSFDFLLDHRTVLDPADSAVSASGAVVPVRGTWFATNGKGIDQSLARALGADEAATVDYTWPRSGEGLWDTNGNQVDSFSPGWRWPGTRRP